ncbi:MAG: hypothetical protein DRP84_09770, partial [Spirochaetes bacterium]
MKRYFKIKIHQKIGMEEVIQNLFNLNYEKGEEVTRQGEFAVRGNIVDMYPFNFRQPVRIEFGLDAIEAIRGFTLFEGELLESYDELTILPIHEFFEKKYPTEDITEYDPLAAFLSIKKGDYVVHVNYGIGIYKGVRILKVKGENKKYFTIEYAEGEI